MARRTAAQRPSAVDPHQHEIVSRLGRSVAAHGRCEREQVGREGVPLLRGSRDSRRVPSYAAYGGNSSIEEPSARSPGTTSACDVRSEERRVDPIPWLREEDARERSNAAVALRFRRGVGPETTCTGNPRTRVGM